MGSNETARLSLAVDGTAIYRSDPTGVDRYTRSLLTAVAAARPAWDITVARWRTPSPAAFPLTDSGSAHVRTSALPRYGYRVAELARVPIPFDVATHASADVWLFPDFVALPLRHDRPSVTVVHDLSFRIRERFTHRMHRAYLDREVKRAVRRSTVVTVSETIAREIESAFDLAVGSVPSVPPAVDHDRFAPPSSAARATVREKLNLDRPYLLFVGALHARKNLERLIEAFALLGEAANGVDLILAGSTNRHSTDVLAAVAAYRGRGRVRHVGYVDDQLLAALYAESEATVMPSVYEGFGIPVLEAMACGSPVVVSQGGALAEASGEAAVYIDPYDVRSIADGLSKMLSDKAFAADRAAAGLVRATESTWQRSGSAMATILEAAVGNARAHE